MQETRYRQRYLDGIVNHDHVRSIFETRARIVQYVRKYLDDRQFLEVSLPLYLQQQILVTDMLQSTLFNVNDRLLIMLMLILKQTV